MKRLLPVFLLAGAAMAGAQNSASTNVPVRALPASPQFTNGMSASEFKLDSTAEPIWENGIGDGFSRKADSITVSGGVTYGLKSFGSNERHHLALGSITYGHMLGPVVARDHWYRGNPELRLELFSGAQFDPSTRWFVGLTPHFRYNFITGTRWVPVFDAGAGVTATSIAGPDLSGTFEFNLQACGGVLYFLKPNLALSTEARYVHWSCAGIHQPNAGLNGVTGLLGIAYFF